MQPDDRLAALGREEVSDVLAVVLEEVLCQAGGAAGAVEDGEVALLVAVAVGEVCADGGAFRQMLRSGVVEAVGEAVAHGLAFGCPCLPATGGHPLSAAGGVVVDGDEQHVTGAEAVAPCVDACAALTEGDVSLFGHCVLGVVALGAEAAYHLGHDLAAVDVFLQSPVGALLASLSGQRRVAVAGFKKYLCHCCLIKIFD